MAASSPPPPFEHTEKRRPNKRKRNQKGQEAEKFDLLRWNPSLSTDGDNDPFALLVGSNELDGGFLSLEEINEEDYHLQIPEPEKGKPEKKLNSKKRKHCDANKDSGEGNEDGSGEKIVEEKNLKSEKGKKKKKKKKGKKAKKIEESVAVSSAQDDAKEELVDEAEVPPEFDEAEVSSEFDEAEVPPESNEVEVPPESNEVEVPHEFDAWNELRLHPQLMKSICRLGFKEPTPIQKACIPAAAHQGKDVIGAAETGSGKTLAFGLPIMQRLLEEREKAGKIHAEKGEEVEKYGPKGHLRALIITPTRELALQVTDHLKAIASAINVQVVPIVGGMSTEKQERLIKTRPEVIVGTPGRLWELMSGGEQHLIQLHTLSFFVLDEADRMIESGHFRELQSIIDMLPGTNGSTEHGPSQQTQNCVTVSSVQRKKRQTLVFSATIALSADFRKKLKHGLQKSKQSITELNSIENLSQRAGMKANVSIVDLTNASILANKLEESFIECKEEDKDAYLYYILSVHGQGRTIVFCTSIAALRHISSLLKILGINVWTLHAQMQQRARLKAMDRFRANEHGILVATDVAARGLDIPGVRTVVHYQLPHSAEVYVHRSGRTARASTDGCSIALISPNDTSKFVSLCRSFSKESFQRFPLENSYMPEVMRRLSLARQIDKIMRKDSQEKAKKSWFERNAEAIELVVDNSDSEDEIAKNHKQKKSTSTQLKKLQQELNSILSRPLQLKTFSRNYLAGAGVSPLLQHQLETIAKEKLPDSKNALENRSRKLVIIGQDCVEPLQALRSAGHEVRIDGKEMAEKRRNLDSLRRKRKEEKKGLRDQRRKQKKRMKGA